MSNAKKITLLVAVLIIIALMVTAAVTGQHNKTVDCPDCSNSLEALLCDTCGGEEAIRGSLWALLPPVIAIGLALITKEVYSSLFIGIVSAALLKADFNPIGTLDAVLNDGLLAGIADSYSIGILIFLVLLGIFVALINRSGGSAAFGRWAQTHVKTRVGAMLATFALGVLIFVDDYFNFIGEMPDSRYRKELDAVYAKAQKAMGKKTPISVEE